MWNYRVASKSVNGREVLGIIQCTYDRDDTTKIDGYSDFVEVGGFPSSELLEREMGFVMAALQKPVVHGLDFTNAVHPDQLIDDLTDAELEAIRTAAGTAIGREPVMTSRLF